MRTPTEEEKFKETASLYTNLADLATVLLMFVVAATSGSLTLLSEAIRAGLVTLVLCYSLFILRAVHRDRLRQFRFGIGKVEQICNILIGATLLASGFWVANRVLDLIFLDQFAASPLGLASAAVINAINVLINFFGWFAMWTASRRDDSPIFRAQQQARVVALAASLLVRILLTSAALSKDPVVSIWLDGIGAAFVAWLMVSIGLNMMRECVPDLLDHAIPDGMKERIDDALEAAGVEPEEVVRLRTRRSGSLAHVELTLAPADCVFLADFRQRVGHLQQMIESRIQEADVAIVVDDGGG